MAATLRDAEGRSLRDPELRSLLRWTRRFPRWRWLRWVAKTLRRRYARRPRPEVVADVFGFAMSLRPNEHVDGLLLFAPQLYDAPEIAILRERLKLGDTFLDIGSHIGFYTLVAAQCVGPAGRVLAVEADPDTFLRLRANLERNALSGALAVHCGVSDREETLHLGRSGTGNLGANSFLSEQFASSVEVACRPLCAILQDAGIERVDGAKFDIEGFEHKVLTRFFADAPRTLLPRWMVVEANWKYYPAEAQLLLQLLEANGYQVERSSTSNYLATLKDSG